MALSSSNGCASFRYPSQANLNASLTCFLASSHFTGGGSGTKDSPTLSNVGRWYAGMGGGRGRGGSAGKMLKKSKRVTKIEGLKKRTHDETTKIQSIKIQRDLGRCPK